METELLEIADVCKLLRTTPRAIRRLIAKGELPAPLHIGHRRLWPHSVIAEFIHRNFKETRACSISE